MSGFTVVGGRAGGRLLPIRRSPPVRRPHAICPSGEWKRNGCASSLHSNKRYFPTPGSIVSRCSRSQTLPLSVSLSLSPLPRSSSTLSVMGSKLLSPNG
ncbi:hypothetical protein E2C01_004166 [Portunus trituberculatus]|uniref:Uncharacterized protein n=1 Tax=Portunus trituberculatus TaxID=210409 RepID=A0A5B7CPW1_PORTR|nr:hypothetical protein [Portunus trituberculatus]